MARVVVAERRSVNASRIVYYSSTLLMKLLRARHGGIIIYIICTYIIKLKYIIILDRAHHIQCVIYQSNHSCHHIIWISSNSGWERKRKKRRTEANHRRLDTWWISFRMLAGLGKSFRNLMGGKQDGEVKEEDLTEV